MSVFILEPEAFVYWILELLFQRQHWNDNFTSCLLEEALVLVCF